MPYFLLFSIWMTTASTYPFTQDRADSLTAPPVLSWTYVFPDSSGSLVFPIGLYSFADSIVQYDPGALGLDTGGEPDPLFQRPDLALGIPDCSADSSAGTVSLGSGGTLIIQFTDNVLLDGPGPDLCILFADSEAVNIWISQDSNIFRYAGKASIERPCIDILPYADRGFVYPYIKLRDDPLQGDEDDPALGADIDAVGAVNTAIHVVLSSASLFATGTSRLNPGLLDPFEEIAEKIRQIPRAHVTIEGHTDDLGNEDFNMLLSQQQAGKIRDYLMDTANIENAEFTLTGRGSLRPVVPNNSENNRRTNRRIEIFIQTQASWKPGF